ncbi:aminoglycoside phosphotransferase family protein [Sulfurovum riftiae]|uniref:Aminoglycoside phosphotransferase n=1 Tax=Sulfurovum riftiae TaxID=1630136 RepID=A0A151CED6_9BACT|nr:phosphotransferase [Sulfurovum riftiae]KYJ85896.1 aminoglycoside phosphotransferase [Sulfurovum riftiae]
MSNEEPKEALIEWLERYGIEAELQPLTGDASLRKYYRIEDSFHRGIVMDASAQPESVAPFVDIAHRLFEAGVRTPKINAFDREQGFVFMEDLGNTHFADMIESEKEIIYPKAVDTIRKMQEADTEGLPVYDREFLRFEMDLMPEWYLKKHLGVSLSKEEESVLENALEKIADVVLEQPQGVFVHRDFHSRNLMFDCRDDLVVIDFQDARAGAVTYDLVSLLRDVYVELDPQEVERLVLHFRDLKGLDVDDETFMKWFDFMGLQRHIKILGIFARLALCDGKKGYLEDIPLTLKYVLKVGSRYPETLEFVKMLESVSEQ